MSLTASNNLNLESPDQSQHLSDDILLEASGSTIPHAPVVMVIPNAPSTEVTKLNQQSFSDSVRLLSLTSPLPAANRVLEFAEQLAIKLSSAKVKRATVLGFGAGATVAQAFAVNFPHLARRAIVVDATARVAPDIASRIIDKIERFLPFGLPMRSLTDDFDSRPLLHRLRCPAIVAISPAAAPFIVNESILIANKTPNARIIRLQKALISLEGGYSDEFMNLVNGFLDAPAKRSQKPSQQNKDVD